MTSIPTPELKALVEKATPGPWFVDSGTPGHVKSQWNGHRQCGDNKATPTVARFDVWSRFDLEEMPDWLKKHFDEEPHNAALIALSPTLAAEVIALRERVAELELCLRVIRDMPMPEQDDQISASMRETARTALKGAGE